MANPLAEPLFDGQPIFGLVFTCKTPGNPVAYQVTGYPGVDGLQSIRLGARGGRTEITGALAGLTRDDHRDAVALLRALQLAGTAAVFTDQYGTDWPNVRFQEFDPDGAIYRLAHNGAVGSKYSCTLLHLS